MFGKAGSSNTGKSGSSESAGSSHPCPQCGSTKLWRNGQRVTPFGTIIQRWLCRKCGYLFSDSEQLKAYKKEVETIERRLTKPIRSDKEKVTTCQICAAETAFGGAKNLDPEQVSIGKAPENVIDNKGKLLQFAWTMQQQGYASDTIRCNSSCLRALIARGANLADPETAKTALAREQKWSPNRRRNVINAYTLFLKFQGLTWEKPRTNVVQKFPFIPTEAEIDSLISGTGPKTAIFLQLLKETAMRCGEAKRLTWTNVDFEKNIVTLNDPEKGSKPRMWKATQKLSGMLNSLPRTGTLVFGDSSMDSMKAGFLKARKRLANKLQNPRLLEISFHTLRHWKATMLYHQTKGPYYVKDFLGHKELRSTEIYINIERTLFEPSSDEFTVKVAEKPEEVKALLEVGFEYICQKDGLMFLRKRL
jgi:integrase/predicted RNA-binding Zn-ribbon protein involved in translation (DUF1610 family)